MQKVNTFVVTLAFIAVVAVSVGAWTRPSQAPNRIANNTVNIEFLATDYRIVSVGQKSVFVPSDEGGTGQRFMADNYELQEKTVEGTWRGIARAWGMVDDVVPALQAIQRVRETQNDLLMFNQQGFTPRFQFTE
jgi:hypothetical protein